MDSTAVKQPPRLIKLNAGISPPEALVTPVFDAFFNVAAARSLFLTQTPNTDATLNTLEHLILQNPKHLRSHAQRLIVLHRQNAPDRYFGALIDLLINLDDTGLPIKNYFLQLADGFIAQDEYTFLQEQKNQKLNRQHALVETAQGCLFLNHPDGTPPLLTRKASPAPAPIPFGDAASQAHHKPGDAVAEANQLIDDGQLDLALDTLEDAVLSDAHSPEAIKFLLQLYVLTGADIRKEIMEEQLKINFGAIPAEWIAAQNTSH